MSTHCSLTITRGRRRILNLHITSDGFPRLLRKVIAGATDLETLLERVTAEPCWRETFVRAGNVPAIALIDYECVYSLDTGRLRQVGGYLPHMRTRP